MNTIIKASELMKVLPKEDIKECGWHKEDNIVVTVSETYLDNSTSFKSISLDKECDLADMDSQDVVPITKKELAGYIVSSSMDLLKLINKEESTELSETN